MDGVREYAEECDVMLSEESGRPVVVAENEGGHNWTAVDLHDLLNWIRINHPEWL